MEALIELRNCENIKWEEKEEKKNERKAGDPFHMFKISRALSAEIIEQEKKDSYFAGYTLPVLKTNFWVDRSFDDSGYCYKMNISYKNG